MTATGIVERHYLKCPWCLERMNLETRRCAGCGAAPLSIVWSKPDPSAILSPEIVLVSRRYA